MFVSPPNSYVETLTPIEVMVLVGGVFERYLRHEKGVPINGISAVIKRSSRSLALPLCEYKEKPRT